MNAQEVYMTAFTSKSYIPGVIALKKSLINTKTKHPLVILIPSNEANDLINVLKKHNVLDKNCFYLVKPSLDEKYFRTLKNEWRFSHWNKTFFKLAVTSCVEFKKIILLDSDLYIQKNIDHLFKAPHYSAVPSRINGQLTGGLIVLEPNVALYKKLLSFIKTAIKKTARSWSFNW